MFICQCLKKVKLCRYKSSGLKRKSVVKNLKEFSDYTTIHGIRYIGEPHRHVVERLCWLLVVVACTGGCIFYIHTLLQRWNRSPVIVTFAERSTPIWDIPFPAVTLCPDNKIPKSLFQIPNKTVYTPVVFRGPQYALGASPNFSSPYNHTWNNSAYYYIQNWNDSDYYDIDFTSRSNSASNISDSLRSEFESNVTIPPWSMPSKCTGDIDKSQNESMQLQAASMMCPELEHEFVLNRTHVKEFLEIATGYERFLHCRWGSSEISQCDKWFRPILTDLGLCYTFNLMDTQDMFNHDTDVHSDLIFDNTWRLYPWAYDLARNTTSNSWNPHLGYSPSGTSEAYPRRVAGKGARSGLDIVFITEAFELQPDCWPNAKSYKMLLHSPAEFPKMSDQHIRIPINSLVNVAVRPTMVTTEEALRSGGYSPQARGCYFPDERDLKYFKTYTQGNCETECLTAKIKKNCGCVPFYLPRLKSDNIRYCSSCDYKCVQDTEYSMTWGSDSSENLQIQCECLPSCTEYKYDMELSSTQIDRDEIEEYGLDSKLNRLDHSKITIHFKETQFITSQRREQYGIIDFIANCGGLLGLFTGFSLISGFEIVYYVTIRMLCHLRKRKDLDSSGEIK